MEIKIDTKKDSAEDIKRMIDFLLKYVGEDEKVTDETPTVSEGSFNLFGDDKNNYSDSSTLNNEDKEDEDPKVSIVEY